MSCSSRCDRVIKYCDQPKSHSFLYSCAVEQFKNELPNHSNALRTSECLSLLLCQPWRCRACQTAPLLPAICPRDPLQMTRREFGHSTWKEVPQQLGMHMKCHHKEECLATRNFTTRMLQFVRPPANHGNGEEVQW